MPVYPSSITADNIAQLSVAWELQTHSYVTAQPLVLNDRVYVSDWAGYIYCADAQTGALIYEKRLYVPPTPSPLLRGIPVLSKFLGEPLPYLWYGFAGTGCISDGVWYLASVGGQKGGPLSSGKAGKLYAVELESGQVLWSRALAFLPYAGSLAVPTFDAANVYAATCSIDETASTIYRILRKPFRAECAGEVFCFDKKSGQKRWSVKATALDPTAKKGVNGAGIWGGLQLDPTGENLLFSTGNTYEKPVSTVSDSVVSIKAKDGSLNWTFQAVVDDAWIPLKKEGPDFDFGCTPILFPCTRASNRLAAGAGNKNGYFYALDAKSGKLLWKTFCHKDSTPDDGIRSNATYLGGRLYVWSKNETPRRTMSVCCLDAQTGELLWCKNTEGTNAMTTGGVTNGLYMLATYSGDLFALDTATGTQVWSLRLGKCSIGSNLTIQENAVYCGTGVPQLYGGYPKRHGVFKVSIPAQKPVGRFAPR